MLLETNYSPCLYHRFETNIIALLGIQWILYTAPKDITLLLHEVSGMGLKQIGNHFANLQESFDVAIRCRKHNHSIGSFHELVE